MYGTNVSPIQYLVCESVLQITKAGNGLGVLKL